MQTALTGEPVESVSITVIPFPQGVQMGAEEPQFGEVTAGRYSKELLTPTPTLTPAVTLTSIPISYPQNNDFPHKELDCEKMAKEGQRLYGGDLIFLVGKDDRGQYILGDYAGHFLNYIYVKELNKKQYIDYQTGRVYDNIKEHQLDFEVSKGYPNSEAFNLAEGRPPFPLIWHY